MKGSCFCGSIAFDIGVTAPQHQDVPDDLSVLVQKVPE